MRLIGYIFYGHGVAMLAATYVGSGPDWLLVVFGGSLLLVGSIMLTHEDREGSGLDLELEVLRLKAIADQHDGFISHIREGGVYGGKGAPFTEDTGRMFWEDTP